MAYSQYDRVSAFRENTAYDKFGATNITTSSSQNSGLDDHLDGKKRKFNYKPVALRTIPLLSLLALTLTLAGLLEYANRQLPHDGDFKREEKRDVRSLPWQDTNIGDMFKKRDDFSNSSSSLPGVTLSFTDQTAFVQEKSTESIQIFESTARDAFVEEKATTTIVGAGPAPNAADPTAAPGAPVTNAAAPEITAATIIDNVLLLPPSMPPSAIASMTSAYPDAVSTVVAEPGVDYGQQSEEDAASAHEGSGRVVTVVSDTWSPTQIFVGNYLPVCLAVVYRLLWTILYSAFYLIEPFRQLMSKNGAAAESAFFAFYQSHLSLLGPVPAMIKRTWSLVVIAAAYTIVTFLPALASESIFVDTNWDCENRDETSNNPCKPRITANVTVIRAIQALLCLCALVILFVASLLVFTKTGLPTRPNSIAAVASLTRNPQLRAELDELPTKARVRDMQKFMAGKRYRMGYYTGANGRAEYGIHPWNGYHGAVSGAQFASASQDQYAPVDGSLPRKRSRVRGVQVNLWILAVCLVGTLGVVLLYYKDGSDSGFNRFFNSNTFGPRFVLTQAASTIASIWKSVEQDAVVMAPYNRLHRRPTPADSTILMTSTNTPISSTIRHLRNGYYLVGAVTLLGLAGEALNIVISGIPYAPGQGWSQYVASTYITVAILSMMVMATAVIIVQRFREPKIPRPPVTLGAVMSYLCGSKMLDDFEGLDCLNEKTRNERVRSWGKRYEFAEMTRTDGIVAWAVDDASRQPMY